MSVFGALNRFISRLDAAEPPKQEANNSQSGFGFQVLRNANNDVPIEPWFDFIIGINGRNIDNGDPNLFATEVRNLAGASVELGLWSAKGQRVRSIYISVPADTGSLGLSLQWTPLAATEDVWHILDVTPNSPADLAGLLPYGDYIIGSPEGLMKTESGLGELVEQYLSKPLRLYVYNHEYNVTRVVTIEPSRSWGGTGAMGCVLGYGALHRIPPPLDEPPQGPGETMFETARLSSDVPGGDTAAIGGGEGEEAPQYLVPADIASPPPGGGGGVGKPPGGKKGRGHHSHAQKGAGIDMDAYFQEGEAKSKEQDHAPSPKPGSAIAPPPKGPPKAGATAAASPPPADEKAGEVD